MADLLNLFVKIGVEDNASNQIQSITSGAIAKAQLMADTIKGAFQGAVNAIGGFVQGAVGAYATYEQQVGGMETFFGDAAGIVIDNAKKAYQTAGMSANQYMTNVSGFAMTLLNSVARERMGLLNQDTSAQEKALDTQVSNLQRSISQQVTARQRASQRAVQAYSDQLNDELEALQSSLNARLQAKQEELAEDLRQYQKQLQQRVKEQQKANEQEYKERSKALQRVYDDAVKAYNKEVDAFRKATDERIKEINREYTEKLKLTDEEEYARIKAIEDQIDALDAQTESEQDAIKKREQQQRIAALQETIRTAKYADDRRQAQQDLADYLADIEQEGREKARNVQKNDLRKQIDAIREEYSAKKEAIREEQSEQVEIYKEARSEELETLQETNKDKLSQLKEEQNEELEALREQQQAKIEAIQEENENLLRERQKQHQATLQAMQEENAAILKAQQRANRDLLQDYQDAKADELQAFKDAEDEKLKSLQESVAKQKEIIKSGNTGQAIEFTEEDQKRAAEIADMAIRDMSDNVNKMGSNIDSVQYAYQGFARGTYVMLDNLKLGYAGSGQEMERLLTDAENIMAKYGEVRDYSKDSFADIAEAIHVVQTEMGISGLSVDELKAKMADQDWTLQELGKLQKAWGMQGDSLDAVRLKAQDYSDDMSNFTSVLGTTAYEGTETVEGVIAKVKAAWENWLISLAEDKWDVKESTNALMDSVAEAIEKILPIVERVLTTLFDYVSEHGPEIFAKLREAIMNSVPDEWKDKVAEVIAQVQEFFNQVGRIIEQFGGWEGIADKVIDTFSSLGKTINDVTKVLTPLLPAITAIATGALILKPVGSLFKGIWDVGKGALDTAKTIGGVLGGTGGAAATAAGEAATAVGELGTVVETSAGTFTVFEGGAAAAAEALGGGAAAAGGGGLASSIAPFLGPAGLLIALGTGVAYVIDTNEGLRQGVVDLVTDVDHLASDTQIQTAAMSSGWEAAYNDISVNHMHIADSFGQLNETMTNSANVAAETKESSTQSITEFAESAAEVTTTLSDKFNEIFPAIKDKVLGETEQAKTEGSENVNQLKEHAGQSLQEMLEGANSSLYGFTESVRKHSQEAASAAGDAKQSIKDALADSSTLLESEGHSIIESLKRGMMQAQSALIHYVSGIAGKIKKVKGPESYDKQLLIPAGHWIMGGLKSGLAEGFERDVLPYVETMADRMGGTFGDPQLSMGLEEVTNGYRKVGMGTVVTSNRTMSQQMGVSQALWQQQQPRNLNVTLELDHTQFGRMVYRLYNEENQKAGLRFTREYA